MATIIGGKKASELDSTTKGSLKTAVGLSVDLNERVYGGSSTSHTFGKRERKASVCLTFDDGYSTDYSSMFPYLQSKGIPATCFITSEDVYGGGILTDAQIIEMSSAGFEFGSHTKRHTFMNGIPLQTTISVDDTTIIATNAGSLANIRPTAENPFTIYAYPNTGGTKIPFIVTDYSLDGTTLTLTLSTPATVEVVAPGVILLSEDDIVEEIMAPKNYLNSLNIECVGFAYPWGSSVEYFERVIRNHFIYARKATGGNAGTNGGFINADPYYMNQIEIAASELVDLSSTNMDDLLSEIVARNALLVVLGHTDGWVSLEAKLDTFIAKVQALSVPFTTMKDAMKIHGNIIDSDSFRVTREGNMWGNATLLRYNLFTNTTSINSFPHGISIMRFFASAANFPCDKGILQTVKARKDSAEGWTFQQVYDFDTNAIYYRKLTGVDTWTAWVLMFGGSDGSFTSNDGKTITVTNGIITNIV